MSDVKIMRNRTEQINGEVEDRLKNNQCATENLGTEREAPTVRRARKRRKRNIEKAREKLVGCH